MADNVRARHRLSGAPRGQPEGIPADPEFLTSHVRAWLDS
jgi:hypothetical protein